MPEHPGTKRDVSTLRARIGWLMDRVGQLARDLITEQNRTSHLVGGKTDISLIVGGTDDVTVTWPGGGFPTDQYVAEGVPISTGITAITIVSQTATTVTVRVTAGLALGLGAPFVVYGRS